jgi:hypothetical protein
VGATGALLVPTSPLRPGEDGLDGGSLREDEVPEQAAQLRDGERQQLGRQAGIGLVPR